MSTTDVFNKIKEFYDEGLLSEYEYFKLLMDWEMNIQLYERLSAIESSLNQQNNLLKMIVEMKLIE